ncbi:MAG: peptidylprolyl isomerase [Planctomycetota bacterium]
MERREWLLMMVWVALVGCGSGPTVNGEPPVPKAPAIAQADAPKEGGGDANTFQVKFETTKGDFVIEVHRDWSPNGADRIEELVKAKFFDDCKFFRNIKGFMVQFGINGDPKVMDKWRDNTIKDDPVKKSNTRGYVTFAKSGRPNSRSTQIFINYGDNSRLDADRFSPFGQVVSGMDVVEKLYAGYDGEPSNHQDKIQSQGNKFLDANYPKLDGIKKATIVEKAAAKK